MSTISRRAFVDHVTRASAGFVAAPWASQSQSTSLRAANPNGSSSTPLRLGIQLYSLRGFPVDIALQHAKDLGFEQVEFYDGMLPVVSTADQITRIRQRVSDLAMSISAHGVNAFTADAAASRRIFEFASALGARCISADPDPNSLASLDALVVEFDIRIAIHNHGPGHRYNKAVDVLRAIENRDERIGACADLGHYIRAGENPLEVIRVLKGRLYGIHLKDFATMTADAKGVILGRGHLDVQGVFTALIDAKFPLDGALSLEYEEHPQDPIDDIRQCVAVAKQALAKLK